MRLAASRAAMLGAWLVPFAAQAQVLKDLPPVQLEYRVYVNHEAEPAGTATVSFEGVDTARGRRLEVHGLIRYTVGTDAPAPVEYLQEASLTCDKEGVEKFDARTRYGAEERRYVGVRIGADYHLTAYHGEEVSQLTGTAGVQRTNWGLFCGGFLAEPLSEGEMMQDYPLLFPA
jgi:hypothetical protein